MLHSTLDVSAWRKGAWEVGPASSEARSHVTHLDSLDSFWEQLFLQLYLIQNLYKYEICHQVTYRKNGLDLSELELHRP